MLQEYIQVGQRIELFALDAWLDNTWKEIARGATVGYKRLERFNAVTTNKIRIRILHSRLCPTLSNFGLYFQPPTDKILATLQ